MQLLLVLTESVSETKGNQEMEMEMEIESQDELKKAETCEEEEPSPRGVLEVPGTDSDCSSSCASSSCSERAAIGQQRTLIRDISNGLQWNKGKEMFDALKKKSARRFSTIPLLGTSYELSRRNLRRRLARIWSADDGEEDEADCEGYLAIKPSWRNFDYAELAAATGNFKPGEQRIKLFFFFWCCSFQSKMKIELLGPATIKLRSFSGELSD